jgi:sugar transferase (PEP-CTERM/EpsH1 system associated)
VRVLFLSPRQCWPPQSGAKLREYYLLRALALECDVEYAYFSEANASAVSPEDLSFPVSVHAVPKPPMYRPTQLLQGLLGPWPLPVVNYTAPAMQETVRRIASGKQFDVIHLDSIHMVRYGAMLQVAGSNAFIVYDWHNIESEAMQRYGETVDSLPHRTYAALTARKLACLERRILRESAGHVVCSSREREQLLDIVPSARVATIENGVDCAYFARPEDSAASSSASPHFIYVGSMDYFPNIDAVTHFAQHVWPAVRKQTPDAKLSIVGARPVPAVQALSEIPGITVTGTVPDVRPYYHDATASIVPLRTGGGTRLKILESMAAGVPVVSSTLGAEGLDVLPEADILIAEPDDATRWATLLAELATSPPRREALASNALRLVRERYDWPILGQKLVRLYREWLQKPSR